MRSFIAPALLAAVAQAMDPTVTFGADSVSVDIPTSLTMVELTSFSGGSCSASDATLTLTAGNINVAFPITACNLAMGDEVEFEIGANTQDDASDLLSLTFSKYRVELSPEYTFTIQYSYGDIAVETTNLTDADMNVEFILASYDENYSAPMNISGVAGDMIYLGLSVDESNTAFDHDAFNFAITNCKIYIKDDQSFEYTFFDNTRESCANERIGFSIAYESSAYQWQFSHLLFLLNNQDGTNGKEQEIECEVKVCHSGLSGSSCQDVAGNCNAVF